MSTSNIRFIQDSHRYIDHEGNDLISVSSFMKKFEPKKDWNKIAKNVAKKQNVSVQDILDLWEKKRIKGSEAGTIFHNIRENELLNKDFEFEGCKLVKKECSYNNGCKISIPLTELSDNTVYPELMIYSTEHMICGQSDKVIVKDKKIHIYDYKTDKSIDFKAYSSEWVQPEKLLPPISHLDNCNGNIYCLKMSMYMYLLWRATKGKFKPGNIILEWCPLKRDEDGFPVLENNIPMQLKHELIKLPYRKKEVEDMLKMR